VKPEVLRRKLDTLARYIERVEEFLPKDAETLIAQQYTQDVIALNLERAVQMCLDAATHILSDTSEAFPETMSGLFPQLARAGVIDRPVAEVMTKAVGLRNLAVHEYTELDWKKLYAYLPQALSDLRTFAGQVHAYLLEASQD
jgi:uncharacterized protein YutE (UPF0331/DUF86 family)